MISDLHNSFLTHHCLQNLVACNSDIKNANELFFVTDWISLKTKLRNFTSNYLCRRKCNRFQLCRRKYKRLSYFSMLMSLDKMGRVAEKILRCHLAHLSTCFCILKHSCSCKVDEIQENHRSILNQH